MSEKVMPAVEVEGVEESLETHSYELAFHVLPTVAEGEVSAVVDAIKTVITNNGGEIFDEEAAERFELAYEVVKHLESKNRKFKSAYFGWIRFKSSSEAIAAINEEIDGNNLVLRHLLVKLTRVEEENPFRFHDAIRDQKVVTDYGDSEEVSEESSEESTEDSSEDTEVESNEDSEEKGV